MSLHNIKTKCCYYKQGRACYKLLNYIKFYTNYKKYYNIHVPIHNDMREAPIADFKISDYCYFLKMQQKFGAFVFVLPRLGIAELSTRVKQGIFIIFFE